MSRYHSYINSTKEILSIYKGDEPLSSFLKKYFSADKKFGSKDRKQITNLCYCFFRLGKVVMNTSLEEKILTGLFLCSDKSNEILAALKPEWDEKCKLPLDEKFIINSSLLIPEIFPCKEELSQGIDHENFCRSFLIQPDLFLRLRPGKEKIVLQKLKQAGIDFRMITDACLALPNSSKIDEIIELDKEAVIQDQNSQRTGDLIKSEILNLKSEISVWDCCAGSGGKSIMVYDINPKIKLTVSDTRESILANLKKRFANAGIKNYESFVDDLANKSAIRNLRSEIIIADVPCSGSGTWSRTPEQLYFFQERKIREYSALQKRIVSNAISQLQPGGSFVYITCSVFKKENEEVAMYIKEDFHLRLKQMEVLKGYDKKADSMFVAVFEKEL
ncbi:MAG TPA: Fmu (Sun) domain-containing protein [Chitinophagaceae bacterium]